MSDPIPIALPFRGETLTGIEWSVGHPALLFLHEPEDDEASDRWGFWPDRFHRRGYRVLTIDYWTRDQKEMSRAATTAAKYLRATGASQVMIIAAGGACHCLIDAEPSSAVLIAPGMSAREFVSTTRIPKLIIGGSSNPADAVMLKTLARASRGWTVLSTYAVANEIPALLAPPRADQIETQIISFLQEYRTQERNDRSEASPSDM